MRHQLSLAALIVLAACYTGCSITPLKVSPVRSVTGQTSTMKVSDTRQVQPHKSLRDFDPASLIGDVWELDGSTAADLVASIVATRYPGASVTVREFWLSQDSGIWMSTARIRITADVTPPGGRTSTLNAQGENLMHMPSERNIEIAVERAIEEFRRQLALLP